MLVTFFRCAFVVWWHRRCRAGSWRGRCSARRRRRPTAGSQRPRGSRRRTRRPSHCRACNPWLKRDWTTSTGTGTILVDDKRTMRQAHTPVHYVILEASTETHCARGRSSHQGTNGRSRGGGCTSNGRRAPRRNCAASPLRILPRGGA